MFMNPVDPMPSMMPGFQQTDPENIFMMDVTWANMFADGGFSNQGGMFLG